MKKGMYEKAKEVILTPNRFFRELDERGIGPAFYYSLVIGVISIILTIGVGLLMDFPTYSALWSYVVLFTLVSVLVFNFAMAGLLHVILLIFRGKGKYSETYQLLMYSNTVSGLFGWIPYAGFLASIWSFALIAIGAEKTRKISRAKGVFVAILYFIVLAVVVALIAVFLAAGYVASNPSLLNQTAALA